MLKSVTELKPVSLPPHDEPVFESLCRIKQALAGLTPDQRTAVLEAALSIWGNRPDKT